VALTSHLGDSFEFLGNREFRQGDNIRDIDWRATARQPLGQPIVREWREEYFFRVGVVLDTHLPKRARPAEARARRDAFERAVSATAAVADYLARNQYIVDIFAAGPTLYHLTAGRGAAYLEQILDILACIEHTHDEPLEKVEPELLAMLGSLTSIICVFTRYDDRRREFVRMLRESGAGVKVILVLPDQPGADADTATLTPGEDIAIVDAAAFSAGGGPDEL